MDSTGIGEKCAPALFLFAVRGPLIISGLLAHNCIPSFCFNTLLSCDIMVILLQIFWTEQTTHRNYLYIRAMEQYVGIVLQLNTMHCGHVLPCVVIHLRKEQNPFI